MTCGRTRDSVRHAIVPDKILEKTLKKSLQGVKFLTLSTLFLKFHNYYCMGNLKKKRRLKMNKHKRRKRLKSNRHKKRTW